MCLPANRETPLKIDFKTSLKTASNVTWYQGEKKDQEQVVSWKSSTKKLKFYCSFRSFCRKHTLRGGKKALETRRQNPHQSIELDQF